MKQFLNNPYEEDISHSDNELNNIIEDDWEVLVADAQIQFQLGPTFPMPRRLHVVIHNGSDDDDDEVMGDGINIDLNAFYNNDLTEGPAVDVATDEAGSRRVGLLPSSPSPEPDTDNTDSVNSAHDTDFPDSTEAADAFSPIWLESGSGEGGNDTESGRFYGIPDRPVDGELEAASVVEGVNTTGHNTS